MVLPLIYPKFYMWFCKEIVHMYMYLVLDFSIIYHYIVFINMGLILNTINTVLIILIKIINDVQAYLKNQQMLFFFLWCYYSHNIKSISYFIKLRYKKIYRYSEFNIGNIRGIGEGGIKPNKTRTTWPFFKYGCAHGADGFSAY